jgi:hypothetical protein
MAPFSDSALLRRLAFLDRTERELYQSILHGAPQATAAGLVLKTEPRYARSCAAVRDVREQMERVEAELLRRRAIQMREAA